LLTSQFSLSLWHEFRYHTIWNTKYYIRNGNIVANPSSADCNGWVYEGENKVIDVPERIIPGAIFNKLINQGEAGENA
jgi:hypothetical protein